MAIVRTLHFSEQAAVMDRARHVSFVACALAMGVAILATNAKSAGAALLVAIGSHDALAGEPGSGRIEAIDPITGTDRGAFATGLLRPKGIAIGPDGNVYVSEFNGTADVVKLNGQTGAFIANFIATAPTHNDTGLTFGPNGNLFVAQGSGNVLQFNGNTGAYIGVFATGVNYADGLVFGPDHNLYVASSFDNAILRFNGTTGAPAGMLSAQGGKDQAVGVALAPNGDLYASFGNGVFRYNGTGAPLGQFVSATINELGIAFGPDANLYVRVIDPTFPHQGINEYNGATGAFDRSVYNSGPLGDTLFVNGIAFDPNYQATPEPGSLTLLGLGLASFGGLGWLKIRKANAAAV